MACHVNMHVSQAAVSGLSCEHAFKPVTMNGLPYEHACKPGCYEWLTM